jgi:hypothetical protein
MQNAEYTEWVPMGKLVKGLVTMFVALEVLITFTIFF